MKNLLILIACLLSLNSFSKTIEGDVLSWEFGLEDHLQGKTLCLTVVRIPETGALLGVVEDIGDCFYARSAKRSADHKIQLNLNDLKPFPFSELRDHLQTLDTQLEFLFSEGE
jgi:hypothetical protein